MGGYVDAFVAPPFPLLGCKRVVQHSRRLCSYKWMISKSLPAVVKKVGVLAYKPVFHKCGGHDFPINHEVIVRVGPIVTANAVVRESAGGSNINIHPLQMFGKTGLPQSTLLYTYI